jgi:tetratricopeptide (TPR) repeat protein
LNAKQSRLRDAQDFYLKSLEVLEAADELSPNAAGVLDEVGYCCILLNETRAGFSYLGRSLSTCDRLGLRRAKDYPSLDMCFARLRNGDFEEAETWGWKALELGREYGREDIIKNSLYLLAESCWRLGRRSDADHHYDALAQYYPEFPALKDYLRQVDLTSVLSLF